MLLDEYCNFCRIELKSPIQYYCDNNEVITKLRNITKNDRNYYSSSSKIKDLDTVLEIFTCIPTTFTVTHVKGHQDRKKRKDKRIMEENLNIKADKIIEKHTSISKYIHICNTPIAVYVNNTYTPNNIKNEIKTHYGTQEVARFLKEKYRWTQQILDDIEWELHSSFIQKQTGSRKKTTINIFTDRFHRDQRTLVRTLAVHIKKATNCNMTTITLSLVSTLSKRKKPI